MKKSIILVMILNLILGLTSCTNTTDELLSSSADQSGDFTLYARYKGVAYEVPGVLDKEGNPIYLNEEFNKLYQNELSTHPTLVTVLMDGNVVEYYESLNEVLDVDNMYMIEQAKAPDASTVMTKATGGLAGKVTVWDDSNYSDRSLTFELGYIGWHAIPQLRNYNNFNDKISSLKIWSYINPLATISDNYGCTYPGGNLRVTFVGYEDDNYRGRVLVCLCSPNGTHEDHRLGNIGWNDKITALKVLITDVNSSGSYYNLQIGQHPHGSLGCPALGYPSISPYSPH